MNRYLVDDPGETSGIAIFSSTGLFIEHFQVSGIEEHGVILEAMCMKGNIIRILYETFFINPKVSQGGSDVPSAQGIGIIRHLGHKYGIPYEGIEPRYKKIGYAWSGTRPPSNHAMSHGPDARALGEYWLRRKKIKPMGR